MIQSEEKNTKVNNDIYFDDQGEVRRRSSGTKGKSMGQGN